MQYRHVGRSGLSVSRLALGTMSWGTDVDVHDATELLTLFLEAGGTLVDTAPIYGDGRCEPLLGSVLQSTGIRDQVVLAGKAGLVRRAGRSERDASRRVLLHQLDQSLRDLGTDHLDLWQVHVWDPHVPLDETLSALHYALETGRTRYVGVSNYTAWQMALARAYLGATPAGTSLISTQVEYSLLRRDPEVDVIEAATHLEMGVLAWSPLGRGVLSGKYRGGVPADSRAAHPRWDGFVSAYLNSAGAAVVEALAAAADGLDAAISHVALAWLRDRPAVSSLVLGARTTSQLTENLASEDLDLPAAIVQALDDVSEGVW